MIHLKPSISAIAVVAMLSIGCRSLPTDFDRPEPTHAFSPASKGALAGFSSDWKKRHGSQSGFLLLDDNEDSLSWRLAVIDSARTSLDLQTYQNFWRRIQSGIFGLLPVEQHL